MNEQKKINIEDIQRIVEYYLKSKNIPEIERERIINLRASKQREHLNYRYAFIRYFKLNYNISYVDLAYAFCSHVGSIAAIFSNSMDKYADIYAEFSEFCEKQGEAISYSEPVGSYEIARELNISHAISRELNISKKEIKELRMKIRNLEKEKAELKFDLIKVRRGEIINSDAINDLVIMALQNENNSLKLKLQSIDNSKKPFSFELGNKLIEDFCATNGIDAKKVTNETRCKSNEIIVWRYAFYYLFLVNFKWNQMCVASFFRMERSALSYFLHHVPFDRYEVQYLELKKFFLIIE